MNEDIDIDEAQIGRVLHLVIDKGYRLQCRPAIVVHDWPDQGKPGYVNVQVITDGLNDGEYGVTGIHWETSVTPNHAVKTLRSWHWPRECGKLQEAQAPFVGMNKKPVHHNHAAGVEDTHNCYACSLASIHEAVRE